MIISNQTEAIITFSIALLIGIIGSIGNFLVILCLTKYSTTLIKQPTTKLVINLSTSDLIFCLFNVPLTATPFLTRNWPFGQFVCHLYPYFYYGNIAVSLLSITFIAINRLVIIIVNSRSNNFYCNRNLLIMVIITWIIPFTILCLPLTHTWGYFGYQENLLTCTIMGSEALKDFLFLISFVIPCVTIILCYGIIWFKVRSHTRNLADKGINRSQREMRLTKLMFTIFAVFVICYAPSVILQITSASTRHPYLYILSLWLVLFSASVNPIIYFIMNPQYRNAFRRLLNRSMEPTGITSEHSTNSQKK
ncbi:G-protein coupled receptor moody-like [Panonychus citri]|uniref:G-protein coupled receptor moody-like n=1 Tax=Panonychus citri TaxID=50023 RepID=UPI002307993B|nr:G-protein coupled receptor moody-like [Panonychus citri]